LRSFPATVGERFHELSASWQRDFAALSERVSTISTAIEWAFEEIAWQLEQQSEVLRSIDHTLKAPSETQANEWRQIGEELRGRGVLGESEKFFLKAIESNPLDYRAYVGLAHAYLQMERLDEARAMLERSLPHAPKTEGSPKTTKFAEIFGPSKPYEVSPAGGGDDKQAPTAFDYKSYSYRLVGHICACGEQYGDAVSALRSAIELSPDYVDAHYDHAQYCAQTGDMQACIASLSRAIASGGPSYFYLAQGERNFDPARSQVRALLSAMANEALNSALRHLSQAERSLAEAYEAVSGARKALIRSKDAAQMECDKLYQAAIAQLQAARDGVASADYAPLLDAGATAIQAGQLAHSAGRKAHEEEQYYLRRRSQKVENAWGEVPWAVCVWPLLFGVVGAVLGLVLGLPVFGLMESYGVFGPRPDYSAPPTGEWTTGLKLALVAGPSGGAAVGILAGFAYGIRRIWKELH
jgi:tetratricopeptide (TPR) repeat protein